MSQSIIKETNSAKTAIFYAVFTTVILAVIGVFIVLVPESPGIERNQISDEQGERSSYMWGEGLPKKMEKSWTQEGYKKVINPVGIIIASTENGIYRINPEDGSRMWGYEDKNNIVCDIGSVPGYGVFGLFRSPDGGCSKMIRLSADTGIYYGTAMYGTDEKDARLVSSNKNIAIVTPSRVTMMDGSMVYKSAFGKSEYPVNPDDQPYGYCAISDAIVSEDKYAVGAKCGSNETFHVYILEMEGQEPTAGTVLLDINSQSEKPVTFPVISPAQISFVTEGLEPEEYVWELDKDMSMITSKKLKPNMYGFGYLDVPGIGYVWRLGDQIHARYGSQDISQSSTLGGAIGFPSESNGKLLVPTRKGLVLWGTKKGEPETKDFIPVEGELDGRYFAYAGNTYAALNEGKLIGYKGKLD